MQHANNGNQQVIFYSSIAWYYGDDDFTLEILAVFKFGGLAPKLSVKNIGGILIWWGTLQRIMSS